MKQLVIGTRRSQLATWQANYIAGQLRELHPDLDVTLHFVTTQGDKVLDKPLPAIGGKGLFTAELESALESGQIDLAVHSLKDLPTQLAPQFVLGAIPPRESPFDVLISRAGYTLRTLPLGATVGTSSLRRIAQIKAARPDLQTLNLRGNVPTRIAKSKEPAYDAIVLAAAGLNRLGLDSEITETLSPESMLPAPGQGALAVQCRADDQPLREQLQSLDHAETRLCVEAERAFLRALDSGCRLPVAALATIQDGRLALVGRVISPDGEHRITVEGTAPFAQALQLGEQLARQARDQGATELLAAVEADLQR